MKNKVKKLVALILTLCITLSLSTGLFSIATQAAELAGATTGFTGSVEEFAAPDTEYKGGFRYMIASGVAGTSDVYLNQIEKEIRDFYAKGYGVIEVAVSGIQISSASMNPATEGVDSDNWRTVLKRVYGVSNELGVKVHIHMGFANSGEPFVFIDENSDRDEEFRQKTLRNTNTLAVEGGVPVGNNLVLTGKSFNNSPTSTKPVAVVAIKYETVGTSKKQVDAIALDLKDFEITHTLLDPSQRETVSGNTLMYGYTFKYTGDEFTLGQTGDKWDIIAYFRVVSPTNYSGNFIVSSTPYYLVDYFSVGAAQAHIDTYMNKVFDAELIEMVKVNGGGFMYDGSDGHPATSATTWSDGLPETFRDIEGYDLLDYLGVIYSGYTLDTGVAARIANDKLEALSELYCQYLERMTQWANEMNTTYVHQAGYSTSVDTMKVMMSVEQPETESLYFSDSVGGYISVTGAAHLAGSNVISNEMGAIFNKQHSDDIIPLLKSVNVGLVSGINQMKIHTSASLYDPSSSWPGHNNNTLPEYNATRPDWPVMDFVADYIARAQFVMQQGVAKRDVAIYLHSYSGRESSFKSYEGLMSYGYTFDYFSPAMLAMDAAKIAKDGVFVPDGGAYKAFVIDNSTLLNGNSMPTEAAKVILSYAKAGVPIVVIGNIPTEVEGYLDSKEDLAVIWNLINDTGMLTRINSDGELGPKLIELGVGANAKNETVSGVANYMRSTDVADYYFLYNRGDTANIKYANQAYANLPISFRGEGKPYLMDLWTGEVTEIADYVVKDGYVKINIELEINQATVVAITKEPAATRVHAINVWDDVDLYYDEAGSIIMTAYGNGTYEMNLSDGKRAIVELTDIAQPITLDSVWTLEVESWTATYPYGTKGIDGAKTTKTMLDPIELDKLISWSNINGIGNTVSGIGYYSTTFTLDGDFDGAVISLGRVFDTALVYINGKQVVVNQLTLTADLGEYVIKGENKLLLEVPTGLINTLRYYGARFGSVKDYGLFGPVVITPYALVSLDAASGVQAEIRADASLTVINTPLSYTVSLENAKGVGIVELSFTFSDDVLDKDSITVTPLNGFALGIYPNLTFQYIGQGIWKGTVKYMYLADKFVKTNNPLDILRISGTAISTGSAMVTLTNITVQGDNATTVGPMPSFIRTAEATADIGLKPAVYSKYDLNKDGSIDETDLLYLVYFYQWNDRDAGWDTADLYGIFAKDCDFQVNGKVDLADMIELTANYGVYDPYA